MRDCTIRVLKKQAQHGAVSLLIPHAKQDIHFGK